MAGLATRSQHRQAAGVMISGDAKVAATEEPPLVAKQDQVGGNRGTPETLCDAESADRRFCSSGARTTYRAGSKRCYSFPSNRYRL
jgi:hypothetical protein